MLLVLGRWCGAVREGALDPNSFRTKVFFMVVQALYTLCTLFVAALAWHSFALNFALLFGVWVHTVFQGAGFYVRVFSARYMEEIKASVDEVAIRGGGAPRSLSTPYERGGAGAVPTEKTD